MTMVDPIADLLVRLRNSNSKKLAAFEVPASKLKGEVLRLLKEEGYIRNYVLRRRRNISYFKVFMHYTSDGQCAFTELKQVSTPGRRAYISRSKLPIVARGMGVAVVSTSKGVMTSKRAWKSGVGGEVICEIW